MARRIEWIDRKLFSIANKTRSTEIVVGILIFVFLLGFILGNC